MENSQNYILLLVGNIISDFSSSLPKAILIIPLEFFVYFKKKDTVAKYVVELIPKKYKFLLEETGSEISNELKSYLHAKSIETIIIFLICSLGFFILNLNGWLILGFLCGVLNIIPYLGPILGAVTPLIIALIQGEGSLTLFSLVLFVIVLAQVIDNFYIIPFLISSKVNMDPLFSTLIVLAGFSIMGALGMILSIPIYLVYKIVLKNSYKTLIKIYV